MPLICEVKDPDRQEWVQWQQLIPGDPPASISHWNAFGGREIYILVCEPDDSMTTLFQSIDEDLPGSLRKVTSENYQIIREIKDGEVYERKFFTDRSLVPRDLRFRHVTIQFGQRKCLICQREFPANLIGRHTIEHSPEELARWPGGVRGLLKFFRRSVNASIGKAEGFPRIQASLRQSLQSIEELLKRASSPQN